MARRQGATLFVTHVVPKEPNFGLPMDLMPREQNTAHWHAQQQLEKLQRSDVLQGVALRKDGEFASADTDLQQAYYGLGSIAYQIPAR